MLKQAEIERKKERKIVYFLNNSDTQAKIFLRKVQQFTIIINT